MTDLEDILHEHLMDKLYSEYAGSINGSVYTDGQNLSASKPLRYFVEQELEYWRKGSHGHTESFQLGALYALNSVLQDYLDTQ